MRRFPPLDLSTNPKQARIKLIFAGIRGHMIEENGSVGNKLQGSGGTGGREHMTLHMFWAPASSRTEAPIRCGMAGTTALLGLYYMRPRMMASHGQGISRS